VTAAEFHCDEVTIAKAQTMG